MRRIVFLTLLISLCLVTVSSASGDMDRHLRSKWSEMTMFLRQGNTQKALELIHPSTRNTYATIFRAIKDKLPQIISTQVEFTVLKIEGNKAKYELITKENGNLYSYDVTFSTDADGKWYILEY